MLYEAYAVQIARDWNVKASGAGYVTRFAVRRSFLDSYSIQYWIPAEELAAFNDAIVGEIEVIAEFR